MFSNHLIQMSNCLEPISTQMNVLVIGAKKSGKTSFIAGNTSSNAIQLNPYIKCSIVSIEQDLKTAINNDNYNINNIDVVVLIYSMHDMQYRHKSHNCDCTFNDYLLWYNRHGINMYRGNVVFINNKIDLYPNTKYDIIWHDGICADICQEYGFQYFEVSLRNNYSVSKEIYHKIATEFVKYKYPITFMNSDYPKLEKEWLGVYKGYHYLLSLFQHMSNLWVIFRYVNQFKVKMIYTCGGTLTLFQQWDTERKMVVDIIAGSVAILMVLFEIMIWISYHETSAWIIIHILVSFMSLFRLIIMYSKSINITIYKWNLLCCCTVKCACFIFMENKTNCMCVNRIYLG